ncbi:MAG: hypothetical protein Q7R67_00975 [bacterium]|nr:hypothetical protein [bacterium]
MSEIKDIGEHEFDLVFFERSAAVSHPALGRSSLDTIFEKIVRNIFKTRFILCIHFKGLAD